MTNCIIRTVLLLHILKANFVELFLKAAAAGFGIKRLWCRAGRVLEDASSLEAFFRGGFGTNTWPC